MRAEQELTRAQRSSRCPSRSEVAPLFAAPASGESSNSGTSFFLREAGSRAHQRVVARAAPCGASDANPSRLSAGGALTRIDPPSDVLCRLPGTAPVTAPRPLGSLLSAGHHASDESCVLEPAVRFTKPARTTFHTRNKADAVQQPRTSVVVSREPANAGFTLRPWSPNRTFAV